MTHIDLDALQIKVEASLSKRILLDKETILALIDRLRKAEAASVKLERMIALFLGYEKAMNECHDMTGMLMYAKLREYVISIAAHDSAESAAPSQE